MHRYLEPELLDHLDPAHPDAMQSRAELRLINAIMGNHRWIIRQLKPHLESRPVILELGAGDGALARRLVNTGLCAPEQICALDLMPQPPGWPSGAMWVQRSIFDKDSWPKADIIVANLFLHHFDSRELHLIGDAMRKSARLVIACEPARRSYHLLQGALLAALADFNRVTCHDMLVSIRAGFLGHELAHELGMEDWQCFAASRLLGSYHFVAHKTCVSSP